MNVCRGVDTAMQYTRQGAKAFNTSICGNLHLTFVCIKEPQIPRIKRILSLPLMQILNGFSEKIFVTTRKINNFFALAAPNITMLRIDSCSKYHRDASR